MRSGWHPGSVLIVSVLMGASLAPAGGPRLRAAGGSPVDADVLLRGGSLHLGDGEPAAVGDVAIAGDRIVAVGEFEIGSVGRAIDCRGLVVCPGFIDLHNHSDSQVVSRDTRAVVNYLTQGCTTIVTGNCGAGPIDVGEYYGKMDAGGVGLNVAHLLPQGALRSAVVGTDERKASAGELDLMKELTSKAMRAGAWGMSTGLIYVPSSYADTDELVELSRVVARYGGIYASHIRSENVKLLEAVGEALEIGRRAALPVHISHFKSSGKDSWGLVREAAELIEKARQSGARVTADQYPYTASSTSLDATLIPAWARAGGRGQLLERLEDEETGPRIRAAIAKKLIEVDGGERLQIASCGQRPEWAGRRIAGIARDENVEPLELALRIVRSGGAAIVNHSIDESDVRHVMKLPWVATASDGSARIPGATVPHPRSYGTFTRKIGHYSVREKVIPLEQAIRSSTGLPARILGLQRRGYLRTGYFADVIVFDPERISDMATFEEPHRFSRGIVHVFVNGRPAISDGTPTGTLAGRALRHGEAVSSTEGAVAAVGRPASDVAERIDRLFASVAKPGSPGCALGVIKDGELLYGRGYGSANLDYELPLGTDSVFYLASLSKQFVAACIALLALDGKIDLDDDVRRHIPELPDYGAKITIRHLIHHTSGLRGYLSLMELAGLRAEDVHSRGDVLELICRQKTLNFQPGERYLYSNTGYLLLSEIVERVSGKSLRDFAAERLFAPLGMSSTSFHDDHTRIVRNRVISYAELAPGQFGVSYLANWDQVGSGGLLSTVEDLLRWDRNFYDRKVGCDELHALIHTRGVLNDGTTLGYAFGLVHGEYKGLRTVGHSGSFMGFRTMLLRFPEERFSVVILANLAGTNPDALAKKVADVCLEGSIGKLLNAYAGRFRSRELDVVYEVTVRDADLVLHRRGTDIALAPSGKRDAYSADGMTIEFERDAAGGVSAFLLSTGRANNVRFERS